MSLTKWHGQLNTLASTWRRLLPKTALRLANARTYLVASTQHGDPTCCPVPDSAKDWQQHGFAAREEGGKIVRARRPQQRQRTPLADAANALAEFLEQTPGTVLDAMRDQRALIATTPDTLRLYADPGTAQARIAIKQICTAASIQVARATEWGMAGTDAYTMRFARQPAVKAMLLYAIGLPEGATFTVADLRGAASRAGLVSTIDLGDEGRETGLHPLKRTTEDLLRQARMSCSSCVGSECHLQHVGLFSYETGRRRGPHTLTVKGRRCAEALRDAEAATSA
jgi:hypothetical protein